MRWLAVLMLLFMPATGTAQQSRTPLRMVAEETRGMWQHQDAAGLVAGSPQLTLQLPGADPSGPVQRQQAARLLKDFFQRSEEVETAIHDARELENGWGLVELRRRYRITGTQNIREQLLLLSYRQNGEGWRLVELRVGR